jgi:ATP-dependent Lhr-like helicase
MPAFDRLSPALQYQIVHTLGFTGLRPVQELTIDAVLSGANCVVLAPTAGGKTEAAFFPLLSTMDTTDWRPVSVLYLSPIRALLNNQEDRVARYASLIGRRAFKWHGDIGPGPRREFQSNPADILLTTPESLEAMLMSPRVSTHALFAGLRAVIVDEVHAFADDDRGAHLSAILERLQRFCGRDIQRIGLSATVGNPGEILRWLQGSSQRPGRVVDPPRPPGAPELKIDYVGHLANAAHVIKLLHPGRKRLVFTDSRRTVEDLGKLLLQAGVTAHVAHGSLSTSARRDAEQAFEQGNDCVIVATSALELGIDVGDLDHVLQIDSPRSVASFMQRMGRTGRRAGTVPNCTFLTTSPAATIQAAALLQLHASGYVEPVEPSRRAAHILAHQILALAIQHQGIPAVDLWPWLSGAAAFADLAQAERDQVLATMLERGILADQGGRLWLGPRGEQLYARRNFHELYAVFSTPRLVTVLHDNHELGTIDARFLQGLGDEKGPASFTLGGRPWQLVSVQWSRGTCNVRPAEDAGRTRWSGTPQFLDPPLCQAIRDLLVSDVVTPSWSARAQKVIAEQRQEHVFLRDTPRPFVRDPGGLTWWTFAGGRANLLLARMFEAELGGRVTARDHSLTLRAEAASSEYAVRQYLAHLAEQARPNAVDAQRYTTPGASRMSKFEPCLPDPLLADLEAAQTLDWVTAAAVAAQTA